MKRKKLKMSDITEKINLYFSEYLKSRPNVVADVESLALYLGLTRDEFNELESNEKIGREVTLAKTKIAAIKKQLAYKGQIPVTLLTFDLRNDHGYRDKPEDQAGGIIVFKGNVLEWGS